MNSEYNQQYTFHTHNAKDHSVQNIPSKIQFFFVIDKISNDYITHHKKNYCLFPIKCDFELIFINDFSIQIFITILNLLI